MKVIERGGLVFFTSDMQKTQRQVGGITQIQIKGVFLTYTSLRRSYDLIVKRMINCSFILITLFLVFYCSNIIFDYFEGAVSARLAICVYTNLCGW